MSTNPAEAGSPSGPSRARRCTASTSPRSPPASPGTSPSGWPSGGAGCPRGHGSPWPPSRPSRSSRGRPVLADAPTRPGRDAPTHRARRAGVRPDGVRAARRPVREPADGRGPDVPAGPAGASSSRPPYWSRRGRSRLAAIPMRNKLAALRGERDWSQGDLAERLGVSRQTVNALERGRYDPSLPLAFKIAAVFERRIERFSKRTTRRASGLMQRKGVTGRWARGELPGPSCRRELWPPTRTIGGLDGVTARL